jgi:hypothetical protein
MEAAPILPRIVEVLNSHGMDVILVGDAAAALDGSPVAALSIEFEFPSTQRAVQKLATAAAELGGILTRRRSKVLRVVLPGGLAVDFRPTAHERRYRTTSSAGFQFARRRSNTARSGATTPPIGT